MEYDTILEERKKAFKPTTVNVAKGVENYAALLRKSTRESIINRSRTRAVPSVGSDTPMVIVAAGEKVSSVIEKSMAALQAASNEQQVCKALIELRKEIAGGKVTVREVTTSEAVRVVVNLLTHTSVKVQAEAAWILSLITTSEAEHDIVPLLDLGCIQLLLSLMVSLTPSLAEHVTNSLANIAATHEQYRDKLIEEGVVIKLDTILNRKYVDAKVYRAGIFLIANLLGTGSITPFSKFKLLVPHVTDALWLTDEEVLVDALWALKYLTDNEDIINNPIIITKETIGRILLHVQSRNGMIAHPAMECLGNLSAGKDAHGEILVGCGAIDVLKRILAVPASSPQKREACWILSNLVACGPLVIHEFLAEGLHLLTSRLLRDGNISIVKEAAWVVCNCFVKGNNRQMQILLNEGILSVYLGLLSLGDSHIKFLVLDSINKLLHKLKDPALKSVIIRQLHETVGTAKLEEIQNGKNKTNTKLASSVLKQLVPEEEDYEMHELDHIMYAD